MQTQFMKIGKYWLVAGKDEKKYTLNTYRLFLRAAIQYQRLLKQRGNQ